jgi:hypothetical protein
VLYAYCVRRAGEPGPEPGLKGVGGAPVELVEAEGLGLWVSAGGAPPPMVERLREHDRVVRAALRSATPLPIRFGTRFADDAAARETLRERRDEFLAGLERVAGRVEMGLRLCWDPPAPAQEAPPEEPGAGAEVGPGRAYLERRRRERAEDARTRERAAEALARVERFFADLELPAERRVLPEPGVAGTVAHLVHRADMTGYRKRAERAEVESLPMRLLLTGPWAPYSFVGSA